MPGRWRNGTLCWELGRWWRSWSLAVETGRRRRPVRDAGQASRRALSRTIVGLLRWCAIRRGPSGAADGLRSRPEDDFIAAGSPWYLTLFGRDSIWAARMPLPLGTELAGGTLRTLAAGRAPRRSGHRRAAGQDPARAAPIGHRPGAHAHCRRCTTARSTRRRCGSGCCTTPGGGECRWRGRGAAARRWSGAGLDGDSGDADGEVRGVRRRLGRGLANQGWKDSEDSVRFADGRIAGGPGRAVRGAGLRVRGGAARRGAARCVRPARRRALAGLCRRAGRPVPGRGSGSRWRGRFPAIALDGTNGRWTRWRRTWATCRAPESCPGRGRAVADRLVASLHVERFRAAHHVERRGRLLPAELPLRLGVAARHRDRGARLAQGRLVDATPRS